jgi:hypothetical protein
VWLANTLWLLAKGYPLLKNKHNMPIYISKKTTNTVMIKTNNKKIISKQRTKTPP